MGTTATPNLGIIKPDGAESAKNWPSQFGPSADSIDSSVGAAQQAISSLGSSGALLRRVITQKIVSPSSPTVTEAIIATQAVTTIIGRKYWVGFDGNIAVSAVVTEQGIVRLRLTDLEGTQLNSANTAHVNDGSGNSIEHTNLRADFVATGTSTTFVVTLARFSNAGSYNLAASGTSPAYLTIDEEVPLPL